jgi:hypothetical protein
VVNGTDKADMLAGYAESFEQALRSAKYGEPDPVDPDEITTPPEEGEHPPSVEPPTPVLKHKKYDYVVRRTDVEEFEAQLNELGALGWRLVQMGGDIIIMERVRR